MGKLVNDERKCPKALQLERKGKQFLYVKGKVRFCAYKRHVQSIQNLLTE